MIECEVPGFVLFQRWIDIITIAVPPGLPISLYFGLIHFKWKLINLNIKCKDQNKIINGGTI